MFEYHDSSSDQIRSKISFITIWSLWFFQFFQRNLTDVKISNSSKTRNYFSIAIEQQLFNFRMSLLKNKIKYNWHELDYRNLIFLSENKLSKKSVSQYKQINSKDRKIHRRSTFPDNTFRRSSNKNTSHLATSTFESRKSKYYKELSIKMRICRYQRLMMNSDIVNVSLVCSVNKKWFTHRLHQNFRSNPSHNAAPSLETAKTLWYVEK